MVPPHVSGLARLRAPAALPIRPDTVPRLTLPTPPRIALPALKNEICGSHTNYTACGGSTPSDFCCPNDAICLATGSATSGANTTAICCPQPQTRAETCTLIHPIPCNLQLLNVTAHPMSPIHTTELDRPLAKCGFVHKDPVCCPPGYACADDISVCRLVQRTISSTATTNTPSDATAAASAVLQTAASSSISPASTTTSSSSQSMYTAGIIILSVICAFLLTVVAFVLRHSLYKKLRRKRKNIFVDIPNRDRDRSDNDNNRSRISKQIAGFFHHGHHSIGTLGPGVSPSSTEVSRVAPQTTLPPPAMPTEQRSEAWMLSVNRAINSSPVRISAVPKPLRIGISYTTAETATDTTELATVHASRGNFDAIDDKNFDSNSTVGEALRQGPVVVSVFGAQRLPDVHGIPELHSLYPDGEKQQIERPSPVLSSASLPCRHGYGIPRVARVDDTTLEDGEKTRKGRSSTAPSTVGRAAASPAESADVRQAHLVPMHFTSPQSVYVPSKLIKTEYVTGCPDASLAPAPLLTAMPISRKPIPSRT